jgi:biopolymer transport protein ExbB
MMLPALPFARAQDAPSALSAAPAIPQQNVEQQSDASPDPIRDGELSAPSGTPNSALVTGASSAERPTGPNSSATKQSTGAAPSHKAATAVQEATPTAPGLPAKTIPGKPHDLSPWGMFVQADLVVKSVMIGLVLASLATWTVWLAKTIELWAAKRRLSRQLRKLSAANSINEAASLVDVNRGAVPAMIRVAIAEARASWDIADKNAIKERIQARLERVELAAGRDINRGTGLLATIGSTAPFVGLFGTVWGIMNSFIGISESQTTNLAIVAPGIAEALLATAFGLVAAIPAVIIYNHFARAIGGYKALVGDASVTVLGLVSRDFDRGVRAELRAAE